METYQKTKRFTLRLRPDQIDKLKKMAIEKKETQSTVLRLYIDEYEFKQRVCQAPQENDLQSGI